MLIHILKSAADALKIFLLDVVFWHTAMQFQALCCSHNHGQRWLKSCLAAFDIVEFLRTEVGAETSLCDCVVAIGHSHLSSNHRVATVCNIGKRTAVHKCRSVFEGLHKVRIKRIFEQHSDGASHAEVVYSERLILKSITEQNLANTAAQILEIGSKAHYRHYFRRWSDVESALRRHTIHPFAESGHHIAQRAVVHVEHTLPKHLLESEPCVAVLIDIVVEQRRDHIVSRCDGMEVASEVQIDVLHRQHLAISATCCATLHAEARTQRWFAQGCHSLLADLAQRLG